MFIYIGNGGDYYSALVCLCVCGLPTKTVPHFRSSLRRHDAQWSSGLFCVGGRFDLAAGPS